MFRIIQEQTTNILKHAKAREINIIMEENSEKLLISIKDNGIGFNTAIKKKGVGLTNIKSRCELYNGSVVIDSVIGKGTTLTVSFDSKDLHSGKPEPAVSVNR
jgi:signal transduction histidine kinase